jgi:hypothetical protein
MNGLIRKVVGLTEKEEQYSIATTKCDLIFRNGAPQLGDALHCTDVACVTIFRVHMKDKEGRASCSKVYRVIVVNRLHFRRCITLLTAAKHTIITASLAETSSINKSCSKGKALLQELPYLLHVTGIFH